MAATGTEYVTLEQLKDLVTNMIQPLVDAVGTAGNVYGVPVDLASDGTVTLAVGGSVTIHQNETLFVCSSEYEGFTAGTITEYNGSSSVELSDSAGQNIAAELVAVYVPTGGTAEVPVGTLSVQGEHGQVFKKTENGTEPVDSVLYCKNQIIDAPPSSYMVIGITQDGAPIVGGGKVTDDGAYTIVEGLLMEDNSTPPESLTSQNLAGAKKIPLITNTLGKGYVVAVA